MTMPHRDHERRGFDFLLDKLYASSRRRREHPRHSVLQDFILLPETLDPEQLESVQSHLSQCRRCRAYGKDVLATWQETMAQGQKEGCTPQEHRQPETEGKGSGSLPTPASEPCSSDPARPVMPANDERPSPAAGTAVTHHEETPNSPALASASDVQEILLGLIDPNAPTAASAAKTFHALWFSDNDFVTASLRQRMTVAMDAAIKITLLHALRMRAIRPKIRAFCRFEEPVSPEEAMAWLQDPTTELYELAARHDRRILAAAVNPRGKAFTAAWLEMGPREHMFLLNRALQPADRVGCVNHEIDHMCNTVPSLHLTPKEPPMIESIVSFVQAQMQVDSGQKKVVAQWVVHDLPRALKHGDGIYLDAGSSCLEVWRVICDRLRDNEFRDITVYTNNFMILQDWVSQSRSTPRFQARVGSAGSSFDDQHLAFYGDAVHEVLTNRNFWPSVIYIGTSGIEFDEQAGIKFGYHAGDAERDVKKWYFECPAKARVIVATPKKIGESGGLAFDVLHIDSIDTRAPIYLVTTEPEPNTEVEKQFNEAKRVFQGQRIQDAIRAAKLTFHWVTLKRDSPTPVEHLVAPLSADGETPH